MSNLLRVDCKSKLGQKLGHIQKLCRFFTGGHDNEPSYAIPKKAGVGLWLVVGCDQNRRILFRRWYLNSGLAFRERSPGLRGYSSAEMLIQSFWAIDRTPKSPIKVRRLISGNGGSLLSYEGYNGFARDFVVWSSALYRGMIEKSGDYCSEMKNNVAQE